MVRIEQVLAPRVILTSLKYKERTVDSIFAILESLSRIKLAASAAATGLTPET